MDASTGKESLKEQSVQQSVGMEFDAIDRLPWCEEDENVKICPWKPMQRRTKIVFENEHRNARDDAGSEEKKDRFLV